METPYHSPRGQQAEKSAYGGAGTGTRKKRTPPCNGTDIELAILYRDRAIGVGVLLSDHGLAKRTNWPGTPAAPGIGNPAEACFVLEHQPDRAFPLPLPVDFFEDVAEFFFQSSWAATSALGCRLSGASFRQL